MAYTIAVSTRETAERFSQLLALKVQESAQFNIEEITPPETEVLGIAAAKRGSPPACSSVCGRSAS